jgi:phosphatidylserine/phosphatidylglycerophosphate/cardiolipin synthase-like enzyme
LRTKNAVSLFLVGAVSWLGASAPAMAHPKLVVKADVLSTYFEKLSQGVIQPVRDNSLFNLIDFLRSDDFPQSVESEQLVRPVQQQNMYSTDVTRFNEVQGTSTFAEGLRKFYSGQDFNEKFQVHARPYYYMKAWGELFHPPIKSLPLPQATYWDGFPAQDSTQVASQFFDPAFQDALDAQSGTELTYGNQLKLLSNGTAFREKIRLVKDAKKYIFLSMLGFVCDKSSRELLHAMQERAEAGVDVHVLIDGMFNATFSRGCVHKMRKHGIKVTPVLDLFRKDSYWAVMHQKVWVRDGEEMIIGGENIINYENESDGFNEMNRDADLLVQGPAVADAEVAFARKWIDRARKKRKAELVPYLESAVRRQQEQREQGVRGKQHYAKWLGDSATRMNGVCRSIFQDKSARSQAIEPVLEAYVRASKTQIFATTPDVGIDSSQKSKLHHDSLMDRFHEALETNTSAKITIITNGSGGGQGELSEFLKDHIFKAEEKHLDFLVPFQRWLMNKQDRGASKTNRVEMLALEKANPRLQVWTYFQYMHAKQYLFDRIASFVGSWNLDFNSADFSHEAGILCLDESLRQQLEPQLTQDLVNSVPVVSKNGK